MPIDKVEVTVEPEVPLNTRFETEYRRMQKMSDEIYREKTDIRPLGIKAVLLRYCRFNATHKLSIVGVSQMKIQDVAELLVKVFDCNPWEIRLSRVDFAIDLRNVGMNWIRAHVRVPYKRWRDERGFDERSKGLKQGKTLYIGSNADLFRFYDKHAQLVERFGTGALGFDGPDVGSPLTRIERQLRTAQIPSAISTLAKLSKNAHTFNPFAPLWIARGGKVDPRVGDYSVRRTLEGAGLRHWIEKHGFAKTWEMLNTVSRGNARRIVSRLADFIPADPPGFEFPDLFASYCVGLNRQLGGTA